MDLKLENIANVPRSGTMFLKVIDFDSARCGVVEFPASELGEIKLTWEVFDFNVF